jgi:hypothetical protein
MQTATEVVPVRKFLRASKNPLRDIENIAYPGQEASRKQYRPGYENYFDSMPVLDYKDPFLDQKVSFSKEVMEILAERLKGEAWPSISLPEPGGFDRTIIALEEPKNGKEGAEFVVARWGVGNSSPVHGHAVGLLHEAILFGKVRVNTYRIVNREERIVRPFETVIATAGTFAALYTAPAVQMLRREVLVHNFTALERSASLHYLSEHTRDGRDNTFSVEDFDDFYKPLTSDVQRITAQEGLALQKGDVAMVRSLNNQGSASPADYGDHYIVITGHPILKEHGLRPQDKAISAPRLPLLDAYDIERGGLVLLKLKEEAKRAFHEFHGISILNGQVNFAH